MVNPRLRRLAGTAARPIGAALDRRFDDLERRLLERLDRLEERVAVDAEVIAELTAVHRRLLERLEARLAALED